MILKLQAITNFGTIIVHSTRGLVDRVCVKEVTIAGKCPRRDVNASGSFPKVERFVVKRDDEKQAAYIVAN